MYMVSDVLLNGNMFTVLKKRKGGVFPEKFEMQRRESEFGMAKQ